LLPLPPGAVGGFLLARGAVDVGGAVDDGILISDPLRFCKKKRKVLESRNKKARRIKKQEETKRKERSKKKKKKKKMMMMGEESSWQMSSGVVDRRRPAPKSPPPPRSGGSPPPIDDPTLYTWISPGNFDAAPTGKGRKTLGFSRLTLMSPEREVMETLARQASPHLAEIS
jgi:hypothetical protein